MKLIFLELTNTDNEPVYINLANIIYFKNGTSSSTRMVCTSNVELFLNEKPEEIEDFINTAIEKSKD